MKSVRLASIAPFIKHVRSKLAGLNTTEARAYFDSIWKRPRRPSMHRVLNDTVGSVPVRIYLPKKDSTDTVVFFHGGGFTLGSIASHDQVARLLAKYTGKNVVSVGYTLAPAGKFPRPIEEGLAVIDALPELAEKHGFTSGTISIAGDDAGGFIALHVAQRTNVETQHLILLYPLLSPDESGNIIEIIISTGVVESKAQARRLVTQGAIRLNEKRIEDINALVEIKEGDILRIGKKHTFRFRAALRNDT